MMNVRLDLDSAEIDSHQLGHSYLLGDLYEGINPESIGRDDGRYLVVPNPNTTSDSTPFSLRPSPVLDETQVSLPVNPRHLMLLAMRVQTRIEDIQSKNVVQRACTLLSENSHTSLSQRTDRNARFVRSDLVRLLKLQTILELVLQAYGERTGEDLAAENLPGLTLSFDGMPADPDGGDAILEPSAASLVAAQELEQYILQRDPNLAFADPASRARNRWNLEKNPIIRTILGLDPIEKPDTLVFRDGNHIAGVRGIQYDPVSVPVIKTSYRYGQYNSGDTIFLRDLARDYREVIPGIAAQHGLDYRFIISWMGGIASFVNHFPARVDRFDKDLTYRDGADGYSGTPFVYFTTPEVRGVTATRDENEDE